MRRASAPALALTALALGLAGCPDDDVAPDPRITPDPVPARPTPEQASKLQAAILAWLECDECRDGELEAVLALGADAVDSLAATLLEGLSPATLALLEHQLRLQFDQLQPGAGRPLNRTSYVEHYVSNTDARYRSRAAVALGEIGGPRAEKALRRALTLELRPDVRQRVQQALDGLP